jgi:hypothetical protein
VFRVFFAPNGNEFVQFAIADFCLTPQIGDAVILIDAGREMRTGSAVSKCHTNDET